MNDSRMKTKLLLSLAAACALALKAVAGPGYISATLQNQPALEALLCQNFQGCALTQFGSGHLTQFYTAGGGSLLCDVFQTTTPSGTLYVYEYQLTRSSVGDGCITKFSLLKPD